MAIATLQAIITKIRRLTGSATNNQLTDPQIVDYINSYYLYDFPAEYRSLKLKDRYTFNTIAGIDTYPFDSEHYSTIQAPVTIAKRQIRLFEDSWSFYGLNFTWQYMQNFAIGNGTSGALNGVITAITNATNAQVTTASPHNLASGVIVNITDVLGMTEVNGQNFTITVNGTNTFLLNVDSSAYGVYISGGFWNSSAYVGIAQSAPIIRSTTNNPMVQTTLTSSANFLTNAPPSQKPSFPNTNISRVQNILITATSSLGVTQNVTDDGNGNLIGDVDPDTPNTINYETGAIQVSFAGPVTAGQSIQIQYNPTNLNIPIAILFYQNQFTLRPVPNQGYTVEMVAYRLPSQVLLGTTDTSNLLMDGVPEQNEWWEIIAFGASKKIYQDRLDMDGVNMMEQFLQDQLLKIDTRTYAQLGKQRIQTMFADQLSDTYNNYGGFGLGPGGN